MFTDSVTRTVSQPDCYKALGNFLKTIVDCEVRAARANGVPLPVPGNNFIIMNSLGLEVLSTNQFTYSDDSESQRRTTLWSCQIDCYGPDAFAAADTISLLWRSDYGTSWFRKDGGNILSPVKTSGPRQIPFINEQRNYEERWMVEVQAQVLSSVTLPQAYFTNATLVISNVK